MGRVRLQPGWVSAEPRLPPYGIRLSHSVAFTPQPSKKNTQCYFLRIPQEVLASANPCVTMQRF